MVRFFGRFLLSNFLKKVHFAEKVTPFRGLVAKMGSKRVKKGRFWGFGPNLAEVILGSKTGQNGGFGGVWGVEGSGRLSRMCDFEPIRPLLSDVFKGGFRGI